MPVIICPKCQGQLRAPRDIPNRKVKCPACAAVFNAHDALHDDPEEEVVEAEPLASPRRRNAPPTQRRRREEYDDDYSEPAPRTSRATERAQFGRARIGLLLSLISTGAIALGMFLTLGTLVLVWAEIGAHQILTMTIGLLCGLAWLGSVVGAAFLVSGPTRYGCLALAIATVAIGGMHLVVMLLGVDDRGNLFGGFGSSLPGMASFLSRLRHDVDDVFTLGTLRSLFEMAYWILLALYLRSLGQSARDSGTTSMAMMLVIAVPSIVAMLAVIHVIVVSVALGNFGQGGRYLFYMLSILVYAVLIGLLSWFAFVMKGAMDAADRRS